MGLLMHGSNTHIKNKYLLPHVSFDYKPFVYTTDDFSYALVRCGKFNPKDIAIKEDYTGKENPYILVELRENAFKDIFDTDGWIYYVNKFAVAKRPNNEYVSTLPMFIVGKQHINNVWEAMMKYKDRYNLVSYEDSDEYFKRSGIDREAYMARRKIRIEKLKEFK